MAIPPMKDILLPLLRFAATEGQAVSAGRAIEKMAEHFRLSPEQLGEQLRSGSLRFATRVRFAKLYLQQLGLVESSGRGFFEITDEGREAAKSTPECLQARLKELTARRRAERAEDEGAPRDADGADSDEGSEVSPSERMEAAHEEMRSALEEEALSQILSLSPRFFETLVLRLVEAMGYGGEYKGAARHTGGSGDGGLDGIIHKDRLGFERVAIQTKRYRRELAIGPDAISAFASNLATRGIQRGVFVTTSRFTTGARKAAEHSPFGQITLVDGPLLVRLMCEHGVGVREADAFRVYAVDENFFSED